jgi:hypothetical protein
MACSYSLSIVIFTGRFEGVNVTAAAKTVIFGGAIALVLGLYCVGQVYMLCRNLTTIEIAQRFAGQAEWHNPFDRSIWNNLTETLGNDWRTWLLPIAPADPMIGWDHIKSPI